jgi:DNA-binding IclR family transcriptional regulator
MCDTQCIQVSGVSTNDLLCHTMTPLRVPAKIKGWGTGMTVALKGTRARLSQQRRGLSVVRALDRGLALLRAFTAIKPRLSLTQLAQTTGLDKGTTRRLLHTLELAGFVQYDEREALYALSIDVLEIASAVQTGRDLHEIGAPYLGDITEQTNTTSFLWVHHEGTALCVDRVRAPNLEVDAVWFTVGTRASLNCGAGPRILLAFVSEEEREFALSLPLDRRTPASEIEPAELRRSAAKIRAQGWELAVDDFVIGLAALGVPIFDQKGKLAGALSITTLTGRLVPGPWREYLDAMLRAAEEIRAKLI